jgi:hypothetical protein
MDLLLYFNLTPIFKTFVSVSALLQPIEKATFNPIGEVRLTVCRTFPFLNIFLFAAPINVVDFPNQVWAF